MIDPAGAHLIRHFDSLCGLRTSGGLGPDPLMPTEVEAWCRLTGNALRPWDAETLFRMDRAFLAHVTKPKKETVGVDAKDGAGAAALMKALAPKGSRKRPRGKTDGGTADHH